MRWVKLYEKFTEWEWHDIPEMVSLFFHLLVKAQYEDYSYHGKVIKRGQLVTSRAKLCKLTGMSQQTIRTCLRRLELTKEITKQSTNYNTLITICNYDIYQSKQNENNQPSNQPSNQPPTNQQTIIREDNRIIDVVDTHAREQFFTELFVQQMCMSLHIDTATYKTLADELLNDWDITEESDPSKKHFLASMRIKVEQWRKRMRQPKKTKEQIRAEALAMAQAAAYDRARDYGINNN